MDSALVQFVIQYHPISICVGFLDPTIDNRLNGPLYRILRTCLRKSQLWTTVLCSRIVLRPKPTVPKCSKGMFWKRLARHTRPVSRSNELWRRLDAPVLNMQLNFVSSWEVLLNPSQSTTNLAEHFRRFIESMKYFCRSARSNGCKSVTWWPVEHCIALRDALPRALLSPSLPTSPLQKK